MLAPGMILDDAQQAVARMRAELDEPEAAEPASGGGALQWARAILAGFPLFRARAASTDEPEAEAALNLRMQPLQGYAVAEEPDAYSPQPRRVRERPRRERSLPWATPAIIVAAIAVLGLLIAGGAFALLGQPATNNNPPATAAAPSTRASSPAAGQPTPRASAAAASPAPVAPQLSGIVTKGADGTGYTTLRLRSGVPANGVYRVVLDLQGGNGSLPAAQLGKGADGYYLSVKGASIDPSTVQAFAPSGVVTGITLLPGSGINLRITTSAPQNYGIGYLTGPTRLVIDFTS